MYGTAEKTTRSLWYGDDAHEAAGAHYLDVAHFQKLADAKQALTDLPYQVSIGIGNQRREILITLTKSVRLPVEATTEAIIAAAQDLAHVR